MLGPSEDCAPTPPKYDIRPGGNPRSLRIIRSSDAHRLCDMPEGGFPLPLETADFEGLMKYLRG
jgi:hypothetical protein